MNRRRWNLLQVALAVLIALTAAGRSPAQLLINPQVAPQAGGDSAAEGELAENVFPRAERITLQRLARARQLLADGRYGEAVRYLGAILEGPEDCFFQPDKDQPIHRSLKAEARRLIGQMPHKGRQQYELRYGAQARQLLARAVASGDASLLAEVSRRFFHTRAGYQATLLLGLDHIDHARPLAGALLLKRLQDAMAGSDLFEPTLSLALATCWLNAHAPDEARRALLTLKESYGNRPIRIADRQVMLFDKNAEALDWLAGVIGPQRTAAGTEADRWAVFRGSAARNASAAGSAPLLNMRWRVPVPDHPVLQTALGRLLRDSHRQDTPTLPGLHPLAVNDVVLMRTSRNLLAVDFATGKRLWEVPVDDPLETLADRSGAELLLSRSPHEMAALGQRMWDDATYGTLSSDGRLVFSIEDLPMKFGASAGRSVIVGGRQVSGPSAPRPYNRLAAHDVRTGKLKWHVGGPSDRFVLRLAETFFLGPPLPLMGRLYVLAEAKGEITLMALDAGSGDLFWSQPLAIIDRNILQSPIRRLAGVSPSYADGILVCPTSTGAVVAVELATRSLLWGYRYRRTPGPGNYRHGMAMRWHRMARQTPMRRWFDATACVVDGHVLVTPIESDSLHCLNLIDGKLLWKYRRQNDLYVACVHRQNVVLVGDREVHALRLADGKPAWESRSVALPKGSVTSGRGFLGKDRYYLPLSSAEVVAVDLDAGRISHVSKSRKGSVPGNLICYKGRIISQGFEGLDTFYQLDSVREEVDRRLAAKADDAVALALRGEILLDEGKRAEAVDCFRRSYQLKADERTRSLLRDALLDGLRTQFAAHRGSVEEIERLIDTPRQRATYLRLMAEGLQDSRQWQEAIEHYLKLIELDDDPRQMEAAETSLSVRRARWIRAQVAALRRQAEGETAEIDRMIRGRMEAAAQTGKLDALRRFLDYFGDHPAAEEARRELIGRLTAEDGRLLEAELVLWRDYRSDDPRTAAAATAELAELLRTARRYQDAAVCYDRLRGEFSRAVCRDGKTGKAISDALPDDDPVREFLAGANQWPRGRVDDKPSVPGGSSSSRVRFALPCRGSAGPFFSETMVGFDQSRRRVLAYDGWGRQRWQVSLDKAGQPRSLAFNRNLTHFRVCGHLLLLSIGTKVLAIDTLGTDAAGSPRVLWEKDMNQAALSAAALRRMVLPAGGMPWGWAQFPVSGRSAGPSTLGPVTADYVCFQRHRTIVACDPLSGEEFWIRHDVPAGSTLLGDEEFVLVVGPQEAEAMVFRALDGKLLGKREVPRTKQTQQRPDGTKVTTFLPFGHECIATFGRQILISKADNAGRLLRLFDPWQQRDVWPPRKFAAAAKTCLVEHEAVGVFEPDGHFQLLAIGDGSTIIDARLEGEATVTDIAVLHLGEQYVLVVHGPARDAATAQRPTQPMPGTLYKPIAHGRVYAFDRDGKSLWPRPATVNNQHLLLNQPKRLPVLTFACQRYNREKNRPGRYQASVRCLDKRSGRKVFAGSFPNSTGIFELTGDPQKHTILLRLQRSAVTMTFTDEPIPPDTQSDDDDKLSEPSDPIKAILKALEKGLREAPGG